MSLTLEKFIAIEDLNRDREFILNSYSINYLDSSQIAVKRLFDLTICFLFITIIGWWLFIIISLLIVIDSKGPVIFKQLRHGKNNRPFYCYKFRTMKYNPSKEFAQAKKNDDRITRVGRFLRRTSMDELPQVFNILLGEMSVVGPRPHALTMNREYSVQISRFMCRHYVKPGITGLAQCKGYRGEIKDDKDIRFRLRYDLFYIKKWSVMFDLYISLLTFKCVFFNNENAY
ncbi:sugar transferase [Algoriphagus lutimaris]|uniref:sugar transferase n=1 Tax=Algoriphagus lutimaris TaxID=613197 RepID=UPI00196A4A8D|nr:sugar transferase [Algoriphagus lutimaris]MBN3518784.1 sugar transferase [Algoriphagus lutimaris]